MSFSMMAPVIQAAIWSRPTLMRAANAKLLAMLIAGVVAGGALTAQASASTTTDATASASEAALAAQFDLMMLKTRGLDPKLAAYFSQAPRFAEGSSRIELHVNGSRRGSVQASFDAQGQLCFDLALLDQANLLVPDERFKLADESNCYDFVAAYPQTQIELRPNREEVSLLVSSDALRPLSEDLGVFQAGGVGGLLNYELLGQNSQFSSESRQYYSLNTELGLNAGDWIVRSRQAFTLQNDARNFQSLYTYGQKTFVPYKSTLQAGQINITNSVFPGAAITGVQAVPDAALQSKGLNGATVEGIAQSAARVEIRQAGALIHTSLVPAGPFTLSNIQLLNGRTDLDVQVIEADGAQHGFTVPAASLSQQTLAAPGYSVAVGKVRTFSAKDMQSPLVATSTGGWQLNADNTLSAGAMVSDNQYQAAAWTLDSRLTTDSWVSLSNTVANAGQEGVKGAKASMSAGTNLTKTLRAGVNVTRQTLGFRDLHDTLRAQHADHAQGITRDSYGFNLGWNHETLGSLTAGYSIAKTFNGRQSLHLNASWNKSFKHATVSLNVERNQSSRRHDGDAFSHGRRSGTTDNAAYLTLSVPLGGNRNVRGYAKKRNDNTRIGTTYNDNSNDFATYRLSAERDLQNDRRDFSGSVNLLPSFAQVNLGYAQIGADSTSYTGHLSGGVALHADGVTLSPYPLGDTFGVAKIGDVAGIKLNTPSGPVWTDSSGNAVIPRLNAYQNTQVEVETKSLPRNIDIQNGFKAVAAGRGSVQALDFPVIKTRRALLRVTDDAGNPLAKGLAVFDDKDNFVTTVVDDGKMFLSNGQLSEALNVQTTDSTSCTLHFSLPEEQDLEVYFETANAICVAS